MDIRMEVWSQPLAVGKEGGGAAGYGGWPPAGAPTGDGGGGESLILPLQIKLGVLSVVYFERIKTFFP
jgi:hypothetical protein